MSSDLMSSPVTKAHSFAGIADVGPLVSSPLLASISSDAGVITPMDDMKRFTSTFDASPGDHLLMSVASSPRLRAEAMYGTPFETSLPGPAWSDAQESSDPMGAVHHHLLETRVAASVMNKREKQRIRDDRRRRKLEDSAERIQDLARSMEVDKSKIAQQAFETMLHANREAEDIRREKWRSIEEDKKQFAEEHEHLRELYHKRELERQKELNAEKERFTEKLSGLDKQRQAESDRERKFYKERDKQQLERFEDLQRQSLAEMQKLRNDFQIERDVRSDLSRRLEDTHRLLEDKLEHLGSHHSDASSHRETLLLSSENAALKQDKAQLLRQHDEVKDESKKAVLAKEKELERVRDELASERRTRQTMQERLEREKRAVEEAQYQKQREHDMREWKLMQDYETEKRAKESAEEDRHREVAQLRRELDEKREVLQQAAGRTNDGKEDLIKERDRLAHTLKQTQHELNTEKDKAHKDILELQKQLMSSKESSTVTTSKLQLEKERFDVLHDELDEAKKQRRDLEEAKRTSTEELTQTKFELQRLRDEKGNMERTVQTLEAKVREQKNTIDARESVIKEKELQQASLNTQVKNVEVSVQDKEQSFRKREDDLRRELEEATANLRRVTVEAEGEKKRFTDEQTRAARLQENITRVEADLNQVRQDIGTKDIELTELKAKVRQKDTEMQTLLDIQKQDVQDLKMQHERDVKDRTATFNQKTASLTKELEGLNEELVTSKAQLERSRDKQTASLQNEIEQLGSTERRLQMELDEANRKAALMKTDLSKEKSEARASSGDVKLLQHELRESRMRGEVREGERTSIASIYDLFIAGLHRCFSDTASRDKLHSSETQEEVDRLRMQLDREKEDARLLTKDIEELQHKLRNAQEDKTMDQRARQLRGDLDKESQARMDSERELRSLRRDLDDAQSAATRHQTQLEQADKLRRDLQEEVDHLRRSSDRPVAAAAAAPAKRSSNAPPPPPPDCPQHLVLRASADLCEDRAEARTIEQSNGLYTLVPGGLSEVLKDPSHRRSSWPLVSCCWERKLPTQRWLYSSAQGAWKVTDGVRSNGVFDLASEVDDGSSFQCLVRPRCPHNGTLPHKFGKWCKGVTVDPPPAELSIIADKTASTGIYKMTSQVVNGWPVWVLDMPKRYLYNTQEGSWQITDNERDFTRGGGLVIDAKHNGVLPHTIPWDSGVTVSLYAVGDRCRVRDRESDSWQNGAVESINSSGQPLVKLDGQNKPFQWLYVEKLGGSDNSAEAASLKKELQALKMKNEQNEKTLRDKTDDVKEERSRADELSRRLSASQRRVEELEKELSVARSSGGGGGGSSALERKLQDETEKRIDAERQVAQFKDAKERNEKLLMDLYEEKPKLEGRIRGLEKELRSR